MPPAAVLDVDGTLVDTVYHHAIAWGRAFSDHDLFVPLWRIHRHIGMGSDQIVAAITSDDVERRLGDELRDGHSKHFDDLIDEIQPFPGAKELIAELKRRDHAVVLASSADEKEFEHYVELLNARDAVDGWTMSDDVEASKPQPDLVHVALEKAGGGPAVMVGDSTFDCEAAKRAEIETIGLLTGGFSEAELLDAGAAVVLESPEELRERLDETPLASG